MQEKIGVTGGGFYFGTHTVIVDFQGPSQCVVV